MSKRAVLPADGDAVRPSGRIYSAIDRAIVQRDQRSIIASGENLAVKDGGSGCGAGDGQVCNGCWREYESGLGRVSQTANGVNTGGPGRTGLAESDAGNALIAAGDIREPYAGLIEAWV